MNCKHFLSILLPVLLSGGCIVGTEKPSQVPEKHAGSIKQQVAPAAVPTDPAGHWRSLDLKKYPNANALVLDSIEKVKYNSDGTSIRDCESWILTVNEKGRLDNRTISLYFNDFYQTPPEVFVELIKPDGKVVKAQLQKNITIDQSQMQNNIYDPSNKELNIGIPDLEIGDIIHCRYTLRQVRPRMKDVWCDMTIMQSTEPVLHSVYEVSAPENCPLKSIAVKDEVKDTLSRSQFKENGRNIYRFEAKDIPQLLPEPDMPAYYLHCMRILCSTAPDWATISRWYYNLSEPRLKALSPELTACARELVKGKQGMAAVRALFDFVSKEIRYTGVTNEDTAPGYEPHDVKDTFAQRHGVCRDKAALLVAMLREAGFDAFMVLFMAGNPKDPEVPNYYFNHAITGVKMADGELVLMDSTDENSFDLLPAYSMDKSFLCATKEGDNLRRTPVIMPEKNMLTVRSSGMVDEKYRLTLKSELTFNGFNDNIYRDAFAMWTPDMRRQFVASALKRILPGAELLKVQFLPENVRDLSQELKLLIECRVDNFVDIAWGAGCLQMPFFSNGFGALCFMLDDRMLKERRYPLQLPSTAGVDEICNITLPADLKVTALPDFKNVDNKSLLLKSSLAVQKNVLQSRRILKLREIRIAPEDYPQFRRSVLSISSADNNKVIVKRDFNDPALEFPEAAGVEEFSHILVNVEKADSYTVNIHKKIKVLNYSGVKSNSELVIPFIPGLSEGKFISGSVTSPAGKVVPVDLQSIQLMDAGDSAAAPRYPAGKKLVVPLPGVEVGSVIEYHLQSKSFGRAVSQMHVFWSKMPVRQSIVEFSYPLALAKQMLLALPESGFVVTQTSDKQRQHIKICGRDLPMMPTEPGTPPTRQFAPFAGISIFNSASYGEAVHKAVKKAAGNAPLTRSLAQKITARIPDLPGKIKAIRDHVSKNIRLAGEELDVLGIKYITPADVTLQENYGNSVDRAVLLYAMLEAIEVKDIKILLASKNPALPEFVANYCRLPENCFDTVVLLVKAGEREMFLNDNNEFSPLEYSSHDMFMALNTATGELAGIFNAPGFNSSLRKDWVIRMLPGGSAEFCCTSSYYGGIFAEMNRFFAYITPEDERKFWEQQFSGVLAGAESIENTRDFKLYPGQIVMRFVVPDFWRKSGDYISFTLPPSGVDTLVHTAGKRTLPYWFFPDSHLQVNFNVEIPESWQQCELAGGSYKFSLPGNSGTVEQQIELKERLLQLKFSSEMPPVVYIPVQAYGMLEELQKKLSDAANRTFLFKSTGK